MKQKDIALIIVIAFIAAVMSYFLSNMLFGSGHAKQQAEVVQPIVSDFPEPDSRYFNKDAFDPTKLIKIGDETNSNPFNGAAQ